MVDYITSINNDAKINTKGAVDHTINRIENNKISSCSTTTLQWKTVGWRGIEVLE